MCKNGIGLGLGLGLVPSMVKNNDVGHPMCSIQAWWSKTWCRTLSNNSTREVCENGHSSGPSCYDRSVCGARLFRCSHCFARLYKRCRHLLLIIDAFAYHRSCSFVQHDKASTKFSIWQLGCLSNFNTTPCNIIYTCSARSILPESQRELHDMIETHWAKHATNHQHRELLICSSESREVTYSRPNPEAIYLVRLWRPYSSESQRCFVS